MQSIRWLIKWKNRVRRRVSVVLVNGKKFLVCWCMPHKEVRVYEKLWMHSTFTLLMSKSKRLAHFKHHHYVSPPHVHGSSHEVPGSPSPTTMMVPNMWICTRLLRSFFWFVFFYDFPFILPQEKRRSCSTICRNFAISKVHRVRRMGYWSWVGYHVPSNWEEGGSCKWHFTNPMFIPERYVANRYVT